MPSENVAVIDSKGMLLRRTPGDDDDESDYFRDEHELSIEQTYRTRIDSELLGAIVGYENINAQVDVMLNFTAVETTYEDFDSDNEGGKTRSGLSVRPASRVLATMRKWVRLCYLLLPRYLKIPPRPAAQPRV